jgi:hypothetical protein
MLNGCNKERYHKLRVDLKNDFAFGDDRYPKTFDQCLSLLNRWGNSTNHNPRPRACQQNQVQEAKPEEALVFSRNDSKTGTGTKPSKASASSQSSSSQSTTPRFRKVTNVKCLNCIQLGHMSAVCPDAKPPARMPAQIHAMADVDNASVDSDESSVIILTQHGGGGTKVPINSNYLLLDSQSTVDLFTNPDHVTSIRRLLILSMCTATRVLWSQAKLVSLATPRYISTNRASQMFSPSTGLVANTTLPTTAMTVAVFSS